MKATSLPKAFAFSFVKMYSIYVTNKTKKNVYVRLRSQKISTAKESFHRELERLGGRDNASVDSQPQQSVNSYLVRWGFCNIPAKVTIPFAAEVHNDEPRMYASLYARSKLWVMDYEVNCARYGCVFVDNKSNTEYVDASWMLRMVATSGRSTKPQKEEELYLSNANPNLVWVPGKSGDPAADMLNIPHNMISAGIDAIEGRLCFGRSSFGGPKPCKVTTKIVEGQLKYDCWKTVGGEEALVGELLEDTGHEFVRAKIGDPVPPNAIIAGVSDTDGTLYLGRVGGNIPSAVSTESDRIKYFYFNADGVKQVESGEIVVLTR